MTKEQEIAKDRAVQLLAELFKKYRKGA